MSDRGGFPGRAGVPALPPSGVPALPPGLLAPQPGLEGSSPDAAPQQAPGGPADARPDAVVPASAALAAAPTVAAPAVPTAAGPRRIGGSLGTAFVGRPATVGRRIAAFSIDVAVVAGIAVVVWLLTGTLVLGAVVAIELAVGLWIIESRTGITPGNAAMRLRTAREDGPFSPGVGRGFVRWFITGAGFLAAGVGAWVVVASSAWDASGRGRSWADRAARTLVVAVPARSRTAAPAGSRGIVLAAPLLVTSTRRAPAMLVSDDENSASASFTGAPSSVPIAVESASVRGASTAGGTADERMPQLDAPAPAVEPRNAGRRADAAPAVAATIDSTAASVAASVSPPTGRRAAAVPVDQAPAADASASETGALLLIFDTGQREQLPIPVAVNLGRNPSATDQGDRLISVRDPESTVSKTHLRLEHSRGRTWVTDTNSTNGTEIRSDDAASAPLLPGNRVLLDEGDRVRIGNRTFTVSILMAHESADKAR
ncbi:RDD family protein [Leifsonia sp. YIM 134122]|uniref:RDD family protein n=1 Tax=Leifsonia stereocauli TaxID=3134136 RepID=A0ABU9W5S1_9MICO